MTTRLFALSAILLVMCVFTGCSGPEEPAQAPEPRPKGEKTKAELLVGKWEYVKRTPSLTIDGFQRTVEYTEDGKVTIWTNNPHPRAVARVESGTYRVEGNTLFRTLIGPVNSLERNVTIESITEDRLVTAYSDPEDPRPEARQVFEYERVREK